METADTPHPAPVPARTAPPALHSMLVAIAFLGVYLAWAPVVAGFGDSSELTLVLATRGLAHPTGYVLYTLLGHLFVAALHALGAGWSWAANAWSALGGAVALGLLHRLVTRLLVRADVPPGLASPAAAVPIALLGLGPAWSSQMVVAEVYSWHLAWVAGACLFAWVTCEGLADGRDDAWRARRVLAWCLLVGVGVSHHATSVLVAGPLTLALLATAWPPRASWLALVPVTLVPPLAAWGYVLHRSHHPAAFQWQALGPGLEQTWHFVSGAGYWHFLGSFHPSAEQSTALASGVFPWLAAGLGAVLVWPFLPGPHPHSARWGLAGAAAAQTAYSFLYGVTDPVAYFLTALAIGMVAIPACVALTPVRRAGRVLVALAGLGACLLAWRGTGAALAERQRLVQAEALLREMWRAIPYEHGFVIWDDDMSSRLFMYQQLDHERPGLRVLSPLILLDDTARDLFARRHGFDPVAGVEAPPGDDPRDAESERRLVLRIAQRINACTPEPVVLFLPQVPDLRVLPKSGVIPTAGAPTNR
jgi:hypothetical protein